MHFYVENLLKVLKLLKERPIKQGKRWQKSLTERANSLAGFAGLIKMSACGREFNGAPILGKGYKLLQNEKKIEKDIDM